MTPTEQNELNRQISVMIGFRDGNKVKAKERFEETTQWYVTTKPLWMWESVDYALLPEPRLRQWLPAEVPLEAWFRHKTVPLLWAKIDRICNDIRFKVVFKGDLHYCSDLFNLCEFSLTPHDETSWRPCGVEEQV